MKRIIISLLLLMTISAVSYAQKPSKQLKKVLEFVMPGEEGGQDGTRGAYVAYNPVLKLYYAAFAGNVKYPMAVFNLKGKMLSESDLKTMADLRGLWYNPITKTLQGNCYSDSGWVNYKLNKKGIPAEPTSLLDEKGRYQPDDQSVGVYDPKLKTVYFLNGTSVVAYNMKGEIGKSVALVLPLPLDENADELEEDVLPEAYNYTTVIFTGIPNQEFGLYNTETKIIELYNRTNGKYTSSWQLPENAPNYTSFNLAYCNGLLWLFNQETRTWSAYK